MAGMSNTFQNDANNLITNLITLYGATSFKSMEDHNTANRSLLVTEANMANQFYAYYAMGPEGNIGDPAHEEFRHGATSKLSASQVHDLIEYVLSL